MLKQCVHFFLQYVHYKIHNKLLNITLNYDVQARARQYGVSASRGRTRVNFFRITDYVHSCRDKDFILRPQIFDHRIFLYFFF